MLLSVCGFSAIPYVYLFSYKKTVSGGFALFLLSSLVVGAFGCVALLAVEALENYKTAMKFVKPAAMLVPPCSLTYNGVAFARKAVSNYNWKTMDEAHTQAKCMMEPNPCCGKSQTCMRGGKVQYMFEFEIKKALGVRFWNIRIVLKEKKLVKPAARIQTVV